MRNTVRLTQGLQLVRDILLNREALASPEEESSYHHCELVFTTMGRYVDHVSHLKQQNSVDNPCS